MQRGEKMSSLYVFFGLIASGKSTLAAQFARTYDLAYFNTDRVRKELAGLDSSSRQPDQFNQGIYSAEFSRKTYLAMLDLAAAEIRSGRNGAVLDGSYNRRDERVRVLELADTLDAGCVFIECVCSDEVVRKRLELRARDPLAVSDGRWEIYLVQKEQFQPPVELEPSRLITVDTDQPVEPLVEYLATTLGLQ
jgi:predicted kinase